MSEDRIERALLRDAQVLMAAAGTSAVCRAAQSSHQLAAVGAIGLGRLLTATALAALMHELRGSFSIQILGQGRLGQLFADATDEGHLRGYVKNPSLDFALLPGEARDQRRALGHAVGEGVISVVRIPRGAKDGYTQSATPLTSGEIDVDVASFLEKSDQVPTVLAADVLLGPDGTVEWAGGLLVQALPGGDLGLIAELRARMGEGGLAGLLRQVRGDAGSLMRAVDPRAEVVSAAQPLVWRCRCSHERVLGALRMLDAEELLDMVATQETAQVRCDFCGRVYELGPAEVEKVFRSIVKSGN